MFRRSVICLALVALPVLSGAPALARDGWGVNSGHNNNRHNKHGSRSHSGAWIGDNRGHVGGPHGSHFGAGHGHFSPRGQGGYHWGW